MEEKSKEANFQKINDTIFFFSKKYLLDMGFVLDKNGDIIARGTGKTKKDAEQEASRVGLIYFDSSFKEDSDSELEL